MTGMAGAMLLAVATAMVSGLWSTTVRLFVGVVARAPSDSLLLLVVESAEICWDCPLSALLAIGAAVNWPSPSPVLLVVNPAASRTPSSATLPLVTDIVASDLRRRQHRRRY